MRLISKYIWRFLILCFSNLNADAQTHLIDSFETELKKNPGDSVIVFIYTQLGNQYFAYDTLKAYDYLGKGYSIAKKLNWDYALGDYYHIKGGLKQFSSEHDLAHIYLDSAISYFKKAGERVKTKQDSANVELSIATCLGQKADILLKKGRQAEAIETFIVALELWKASNQPRKDEAVGTYYGKIASTYYELKQYEKALQYDKLSLGYYLISTNEEAIAWAYLYISDDFNSLKNIDSSEIYISKAAPLIKRLNHHRLNAQYYGKLAHVSTLKKDYRTAIRYYEKVIEEAKTFNFTYSIFSTQRAIGISYSKLEEYPAARKYLLLALSAAIKGNYTGEKMDILQALVTVEEKTNHPKEAYQYLKQAIALRDSVNQENSRKAVAEIENKYQSSEKSKTILQLEKNKEIQRLSIRQKSVFNYFLLAIVSAILVAAFLAYRNIRQRNSISKKEWELQNQQIRELEKDKQLVAVDSMLKGQENERSRLAKDLHDGLGGLLSGIKFSLGNIKDNLVMTPDNVNVFDRSLNMIDTSIKELRRVAHNMMPEMLIKFGLDEALKEYCNAINTAQFPKVKYQSTGMEARVDSSIEIIVYRIAQELLNNTMKHASATEVFIQLIRDENRLSIVVEDNGKGFNTALLNENKGAGWMNIRSRVDYLKGKLDIHSEPGKGTLVNIEINQL